jgi:hypothetical protein
MNGKEAAEILRSKPETKVLYEQLHRRHLGQQDCFGVRVDSEAPEAARYARNHQRYSIDLDLQVSLSTLVRTTGEA